MNPYTHPSDMAADEGLDARNAQAVWPGVNQAALARAFDGLESQSLTFDQPDLPFTDPASNRAR
jgi:hypothetical protein